MSDQPVYIAAARRTPIGSYLGALSSLKAPELGARAIGAALTDSGLTPSDVGQVYMGNVLSAGIGQAPARQAALGATLPDHVPCTTVSKVCGSGLEAIILGTRALKLGDHEVVVAGGMESMSQTPYYLDKAREGYRLGNGKLVDGMIHDGLWDPHNDFHMGVAGELCAKEHDCDREAQDAFARESYARATAAQREGWFDREITALEIPGKRGTTTQVSQDEEPSRGQPEKFPRLRPAFKPDGTITAANASSLNDGAAALVLCNQTGLEGHGLKPRARIVGYGGAAQAPEWFTTAPAKAIKDTLKRTGLGTDDIDLWEINEAFSCVTMACSKLAGLDPARVNVHGGAVALGHPIGASGARIVVTLLHALERRDLKRGLATLCIGGGEALGLVIERL